MAKVKTLHELGVRQQAERRERAVVIAKAFHDEYEGQAPEFGWVTQGSTRQKTWDELPEANRSLMIAVVLSLIEREVIR